MPDLTIAQRFGTNVSFDETTKVLSIDLNDLTDTGDIINNLGLDLTSLTAANLDDYASKILYGLILLSAQQQPTDGATDPELKIFLTEGGLRIGTGTRQGQLQRVINLNVYTSESNLNNLVDIDAV